MMRFSVVIPCHNAERWIDESIGSVLNQSLPPVQVILLNDRSTDRLEQKIQRYRELDFFEYYQVHYGNAAQTRNESLKYVRGDWIAFLDADDVWYPDHLQRVAGLLENDPSSAGLINHYDFYSLDSKIIKRPCEWNFSSSRSGLSDEDFLKLYARLNCFVGMSACTVSARRFRAIGGFDTTLKRRHDIDMWLRLICGQTWAVDMVSSSAYRENVPGNISQNQVDRDLYKLRGLLKNKDSYRDHAEIYQKITRNTAISALNKSILYGDAVFQKEVMSQAAGEIDFSLKAFFRIGFLFAMPYRWLYKTIRFSGLRPKRLLFLKNR